MRFDLITQRDEDYWDKYKATPKAFVPLATAQDLWKSRYGNVTSLLITPHSGLPLDQARQSLESALLKELPLAELGMSFQPLKARGIEASSGTTDFSGLFFGFSLFLIISASILVSLMFRLGLERRSSEIGLWLAFGSTNATSEECFWRIPGRPLDRRPSRLFRRGRLRSAYDIWPHDLVGGSHTHNRTQSPRHSSIADCRFFHRLDSDARLNYQGASSPIPIVSSRTSLRANGCRTFSGNSKTSCRTGILLCLRNSLSCGGLIVANLSHLLPASQAFGGLSWNTVTFFVAGLLILIGCNTSSLGS